MGTVPEKTILLVDDEPGIRETLGLILKSRGYSVATASSGEEAVQKALQLRPNLVLSDVYMPGALNGIASAVIIRQAMPGVAIVLFSGHAGVTDLVEEASRHGHSFVVLAKPVDPQDLFATLDAALKGGRSEGEGA